VSLGRSSFAAMERLCQQTEVLINEISDEGGAAAFINIRNDFLSV
jgi:Ran-binding protein 9/10